MRKVLKRTATGKYADRLEGMTEFAARVAKELLEAYPDVDYFDLEGFFDKAFGCQYALAMMREGLEIKESDCLKVGDSVKIIGTADCLGKEIECIPIGRCATVEYLDEQNGYVCVKCPNSLPFWYAMTAIERIKED